MPIFAKYLSHILTNGHNSCIEYKTIYDLYCPQLLLNIWYFLDFSKIFVSVICNISCFPFHTIFTSHTSTQLNGTITALNSRLYMIYVVHNDM